MVGTVVSSPKAVEQLPLGALDPQEHIANLKEAAKGEQEEGAAAAANGNGNGHSSDSGSSQAAGATGRSELCFFGHAGQVTFLRCRALAEKATDALQHHRIYCII